MEEKAKSEKSGRGNQKVAFYKLSTFSDQYDIVLMAIGNVSAVGNGLSQPFMSILMGHIINGFGFSDDDHVVKEVSYVRISNDWFLNSDL
ncbi:ABC transporter B family member 7 [Cardamine amara subsp. amara]|uniref:ABC transporter B family member 7 n=1 Tax=Cardamine amara subsp. amara TaxID=228776 RepID=A0ABD1AMG4_CARAN